MSDVQFHLFHSIKGGCGKSANAYFLVLRSIFAGLEAQKTHPEKTVPKVCLVDADFRGSGLFYVYKDNVQGKNALHVVNWKESTNPLGVAKGKDDDEKELEFYTDNILRNEEPAFSEVIERVQVKRDGTTLPNRISFQKDWSFDLALCNPGSATKSAFVTNTSSADGNTVNISYFKNLFKGFLLKLASKYDIIILDLSPGTDEYTKSIFSLCYNHKFATDVTKYCKNHSNPVKEPKEVGVNLHLVTTRDASHVTSTANELVKVLTNSSMAEKGPDQIEVIVSETAATSLTGSIPHLGNNGSETYISTGITTNFNPEGYAPNELKMTTELRAGTKFDLRYWPSVDLLAGIPEQYKSTVSSINNAIANGVATRDRAATYRYQPYVPEYDLKNSAQFHLLQSAKRIAYEVVWESRGVAPPSANIKDWIVAHVAGTTT